MTSDEVDRRLAKVAALRALCLSLPHLGPAGSVAARFADLVRSPAAARPGDIDVLVAGWRHWWRTARAIDIATMAPALPSDLVDSDRWLATYAAAARQSQTQQRLAMLRRTYDAFNRRDIDAVLATLAPDVEWPDVLEQTTLRGHEAVRRYWERQFQQIDPHVDPIDIVPDGGELVVDVHQVVRDRPGRVVRDDRVGHRYTFRGELIVRMQVCALPGVGR